MRTLGRRHAASRGRVLIALGLGLAAAAAMAIPTLLVARDETAAHAQLHVASAAIVMAVAAAVALVWRSPRRRSEWLARLSLLSTLSLLALAQLTESGGAYAWGPDGETLTSPGLHVLHSAAALTGAAALFAVGASAVAAVATLGARHKTSRPYRPQTNGKAERFIRTLLDEWAYARLYQSNDHRLAQLPRWLAFYNSRRPHTALGGRPPASVVNNVEKNYS